MSRAEGGGLRENWVGRSRDRKKHNRRRNGLGKSRSVSREAGGIRIGLNEGYNHK